MMQLTLVVREMEMICLQYTGLVCTIVQVPEVVEKCEKNCKKDGSREFSVKRVPNIKVEMK